MFDSLDENRVTRAQMKITALSSGGSFLDGYDISIISVAILTLTNQFSLSSSDTFLLLGSTFIGMILGGVTLGYLTDLRGRRYLFLLDMVLFIVFTLLSAIASSFIEILVFRLLLGVAIGADYAISPTIIAEFSPVKHRGKLLSINGLSWFIGAAGSFAIGALLTPLGISAWRYMFLIGIIPAVVVLILRFSIPESPRWLIQSGRKDQAMKSLREVGVEATVSSSGPIAKTSVRQLFSKPYRSATLFISVFWFCLDAVSYAIALQGPTILVSLGMSDAASAGASSIIAFLAIIGAVLAIPLIDKVGRKPLTVIGFASMVVTLFAASLVFMTSRSILLIVTLFVLFEIGQEFGPGITNSIYPQELFPTNIRATAQGFGTTVSRIGAVVGIFAFGGVSGSFGYSGGLLLLVAISIIGLVVTIKYGIETKGKSLEDLTTPAQFLKD